MATKTRRRSRKRKAVRGLRGVARSRADGFRLGWQHGHWYGQCESVLRHATQGQFFPVRQAHVLFVATGKGVPYSPLDEAVANALRAQVTQLTVTNAQQPVAEIAIGIRPDIVIVLDGLQFNVAEVDAMRSAGIRTAIWFTDDPYYTDITAGIAPHYDEVFTLELACVDYYRQQGCPNVYYLPLGADPEAFRPRNPLRSQRHDICFIGSAYWKRVEFFNHVTRFLAKKDTHISGIWWDRLKDFRLMKSKIQLGRWMSPKETANMYNGAKIVINMHRAHDEDTFNSNSAGIGAESPNPRTFEIAACGALQLTDVRNDIVSFYTPGVDIVTYSSPQEMIDKIRYYLVNEEERKQIAMRGMYRTMREHTYGKRIERMLSILFPV
ncbi:CgeB family protein [Paenibacillus montanisoli]|uniref:Spore maturation protein cgeB n=1 Tax=Paenibacillus montanisoli TaxID=2081970 RepID=A0A328U461_9BACL|nr:glycosyltransferase [Paenibacillus montanisoli]RAP77410.1 spore maturation protein cgeB [Paenibacillus montanisoli]